MCIKVEIVKRFLQRFARRARSRGEHVLRRASPVLVRDLHIDNISGTRMLMLHRRYATLVTHPEQYTDHDLVFA